jgi:voltage-gated potassium channel
MLRQLIFAFVLITATVVIHAVGTVYAAIPAARVWTRRLYASDSPWPVWMLIRLVSVLLVLHLVESAVWAAAITLAGVFPDFESSLYYSLKSYTTVGYGDLLPPVSWRLLGPIEAAVGVLMLGWSTAIIVAAVQRIFDDRAASSTSKP